MLKTLKIKNFAIIDDMEVDFKDGFSAIIGETGSGKSIIIEALNLILGARSSSSMIRSGCEKTFLHAEFNVTSYVSEYLDSIDIDCDDTLEIVRVLNVNGKSSYKINGETVTLATISKVRDMIIEIKRQSDNEVSSDEFFAIKLIDKFANITSNSDYINYLSLYEEYKTLCSKISEIKNSKNNIDVEYVKLQIDRIEKLSTYEGEYEELIEKSKKSSNAFQICELGDKLKSDLEQLYNLNVSIKNNYTQFKSIGGDDCGDYEDIATQVEDFVNSFSFEENAISESELELCEARIYEIKKVYDLYGGSYSDVMSQFDKLNEQLFQYENGEHLLLKYESELALLKEKLTASCEAVNAVRENYAQKMSEIVGELLRVMYMEDAAIKFVASECEFNEYGNCNLSLHISTNNNNYMPLNEIASGGEKARVILALKKVIVDNNDVGTIIFDEIDTGVSGRVASAMGKVMLEIAKNTQVIAITHLPQVASVASACLQVNKSKADDSVVSNIEYVEGESKVEAIAKILSGDVVTQEAISNARRLMMED